MYFECFRYETMNINHDEGISEKITDLTESLYRTTDVLSSADRMICLLLHI